MTGLANDAVKGIRVSPEPPVLPLPGTIAHSEIYPFNPLPISFPETPTFADMIREFVRVDQLPPLGTPARPYDMIVPAWVNQHCIDQDGMTAQEWVDYFWPTINVRVSVVNEI